METEIHIKRYVWDWTYMRWEEYDTQTHKQVLKDGDNPNMTAAKLLDPILQDTFKPAVITTKSLKFSDWDAVTRYATKENNQAKIVIYFRLWTEA